LASGGTETILLVEDEESLRAVVQEMLESLGYSVLTAGCSDEALKLAGAHPGKIDLLLSDVLMPPTLDGPELADELARMRPGIKVIFMSGFAAGSIAPEGELKPGTVLVHKPFSLRLLSAKLREVLDS
jgi:two-component system, cell cycle sensor histidine kinase and response regulator CckA